MVSSAANMGFIEKEYYHARTANEWKGQAVDGWWPEHKVGGGEIISPELESESPLMAKNSSFVCM